MRSCMYHFALLPSPSQLNTHYCPQVYFNTVPTTVIGLEQISSSVLQFFSCTTFRFSLLLNFPFGNYWMLNLSGRYSILLVLYVVGKALRWGLLPDWGVCPRWSKWWIQILVMSLSEGLNVHKELTRNLMKCKNCSTNVRCLPHSGGNLTFVLSALQLH
jgi:hypothetical protein